MMTLLSTKHSTFGAGNLIPSSRGTNSARTSGNSGTPLNLPSLNDKGKKIYANNAGSIANAGNNGNWSNSNGISNVSDLLNAIHTSAAQNSSFNAAQAQLNRDWQERMSNTAYQRAVKDLEAAGLNPVLASWNGGASTGSGATASADTSGTSSTASIFNSMIAAGSAATVAGIAAGASMYGSNLAYKGTTLTTETNIRGQNMNFISNLLGSMIDAVRTGTILNNQNKLINAKLGK